MASKGTGKAASSKSKKPGKAAAQTTAAPASKGPGRPPGSENIAYAAAIHVPAVCPDCNSTNLIAKRGSKPIVRDLIGKLPSGLRYDKVRWQRSLCNDCGQFVTVRTYFPAKDNA